MGGARWVAPFLGMDSFCFFNSCSFKRKANKINTIYKWNVDAEIICKAGPLDENEWAQMQRHPEFGLAILNEHLVSDAVKACCFEHHESFTGNGYPMKLQAHEIHPMARIVAITDTYDALTTKRTYNEPMSPEKALKFIKNKLIARFDPDLVNAMYSVLFKMQA